MSTKIFVGRLAEGTASDDLLALFQKFGTVTECAIMGNYGFVHMSSETEAKAAIADLDGYSVKGSHIHVEMSTPNTQGRKKRSTDSRDGGGRYEPYPPARQDSYYAGHRGGASSISDRGGDRQQASAAAAREEYASEQVKDLLELYFRDPYAFDQYAKTYYYGERAERERARAVYHDRRIPEPELSAGYAKPYGASASADAAIYSSRSLPSVSASRIDDRYRGGASSSYVGGRI